MNPPRSRFGRLLAVWRRKLCPKRHPARPPLPDTPYRRFYTRDRSFAELCRRQDAAQPPHKR